MGNNMVDGYMHIHTMYPSGDTLSFAVYTKVFGVETDYLEAFGDDEAVAHVYDTTRGLGLKLSRRCFYPGENEYTEIRLDNGDGMFIGSNEGGVSRKYSLELTAMDRAYIAGYNIIHASILNCIENKLLLIRQASSSVSMDFSDGVDEEYLRQCTPYVSCTSTSYSNMSGSETEKQMTLIRKFGYEHIVTTTGRAKGALVMMDGHLYEQPLCLVEAVDITGAGDSFITCSLISYVDIMRDFRNLPSASGAEGAVTAADYQDLTIGTSLYRVAAYSAGNYQKEGSSGFGRVFQYE